MKPELPKGVSDEDRQAMADRLQQTREAMQLKLEQARRAPPAPTAAERQRWYLLVLVIVLLLALFRECACAPPPEPAHVCEPCPEGPVEIGPPIEVPPGPPPPIKGRIKRKPRPSFEGQPPPVLPWIAAFRMQVAARSPRLAECFVGTERPGRLKWTTSVEPNKGLVGEHTLEPMLLTDELGRKERECVLEVLSNPAYRLDAGEERSTPSRVGLVIEF